MPKPEVKPDEPLLLAVREQVVAEIIERLTRELKHPIVLTVSAVQDGAQFADLGTLESKKKKKGDPQYGEARLRFRSTGDPNRFLFLADGMLQRDDRNPTYSGFNVYGAVTRDPATGSGTATFTTWAVKHNDPEWTYWA